MAKIFYCWDRLLTHLWIGNCYARFLAASSGCLLSVFYVYLDLGKVESHFRKVFSQTVVLRPIIGIADFRAVCS